MTKIRFDPKAITVRYKKYVSSAYLINDKSDNFTHVRLLVYKI